MMEVDFAKHVKPIFHPNGKFNGNELKYVMEYLNSESKEIDQTFSSRLEEEFCKKYNMKYAISHNSGTSTLHSCLHAADVGCGDEVIIPTYTVICLAYAVIQQNAIPIFADSDKDTFNLSPESFKKNITERTKAVIVVHMHGGLANMDEIMKIAEENQIIVIEDCAQSVLATYKEKLSGTIGDMSSFSFETKKHMTSGQGGMVLTNNDIYAEIIRKHAGLGYKTLGPKEGMGALLPKEFQDPNFKRHDTLGYNYRFPEVCAAIALAQFERIEKLVERRRQVANLYRAALDNCDWIIPQSNLKSTNNAYWSYAAKYFGEKKYGVRWRQFYDLFNKNGGDGFFGALSLQHKEIVMSDKPFLDNYYPKELKNRILQNEINCPIAEEIQPIMMVFKCGYRDLKEAKKIAHALQITIKEIEELNG